MPISVIGGPKRRFSAGFTVVELMMVLLVVGLVVALGALSLPPDRDSLRAEGERLAARLDRAAQAAVLAGTPIGFHAGRDGYHFSRRAGADWLDYDRGHPLGFQPWSSQTAAIVRLDGDGERLRATGGLPPLGDVFAVSLDPDNEADARQALIDRLFRPLDDDSRTQPDIILDPLSLNPDFTIELSRGTEVFAVGSDDSGVVRIGVR